MRHVDGETCGIREGCVLRLLLADDPPTGPHLHDMSVERRTTGMLGEDDLQTKERTDYGKSD